MVKDDHLIVEFCNYQRRIKKLAKLTLLRNEHVCFHWSEFLKTRKVKGLKKASPDDILAWITFRLAKSTVTDKTLSRELCILKTFYNYCTLYAGLAGAPTDFLPEFICNPTSEQAVLSVDEVFDILETFDVRNPFGLRNYILLALLWSTGLRSGELLALQWRDIDLDNGTLLVRKGKGNKQRQLFLNERVLEDITRYRKNILAGERVPVFCSYPNSKKKGIYDSGLSYQQVTDIIKVAIKKAGIKKKAGIMTFRHTFATHMYEAGAPVRDIAEMMGHTKSSETSIYIHVTIDFIKQLFKNHAYSKMKKGG